MKKRRCRGWGRQWQQRQKKKRRCRGWGRQWQQRRKKNRRCRGYGWRSAAIGAVERKGGEPAQGEGSRGLLLRSPLQGRGAGAGGEGRRASSTQSVIPCIPCIPAIASSSSVASSTPSSSPASLLLPPVFLLLLPPYPLHPCILPPFDSSTFRPGRKAPGPDRSETDPGPAIGGPALSSGVTCSTQVTYEIVVHESPPSFRGPCPAVAHERPPGSYSLGRLRGPSTTSIG